MSDYPTLNCVVCRSIAGIERISPAPFIYEGEHWNVDHAYPTAHRGWLVIVLKRHAEALHELSQDEFLELGELQYRVVQAFVDVFSSSKEYLLILGEAAGFSHLHVHAIQRPADLPVEARGMQIFKRLQPTPDELLGVEEIAAVSEQLAQSMRRMVASRSGPTEI